MNVPGYTVREFEYTRHLFDIWEIVFVAAIFIGLAYSYIEVTKHKDKYVKWINPKGREVNLYLIVRMGFWAYTATVMILGLIAIKLAGV
jgi:hypothetical protein